jgi:pimeloyl-ACP methyl ester carboxylesterase
MRSKKLSLLLVLALVGALLSTLGVSRADAVARYEGMFKDGASYLIEVPANWNGTLVLYSHGYTPGPDNPARDVGDPLLTGAWLLGHGYALGGSSYATTGWAVEQAFPDQIQVIDTFSQLVQRPFRTIAWGHSMGGMISAGLVQLHPERFAGALPMCGVVAGGVGIWNQTLDSAFVFKTLLAPASQLQLVNIANPAANFTLAKSLAAAADADPAGRARLALVAAMADVPGWFDPLGPEPARNDFTTQLRNQLAWEVNVDFPFAFAARAELERRAGGNPSWNSDVDYRRQLALSVDRLEVETLYRQAGLDLGADLAKLAQAARIQANPSAVGYLERNIVFNGQLGGVPVLTLHTTGDGLVQVQNEDAYADVVHDAGQGGRLRQVFIHRAGHCTFTPAETIAAFQALVRRIDRGEWPNLAPAALNTEAREVGKQFNVFSPDPSIAPVAIGPAYLRYQPSEFLREFDARGEQMGAEGQDGGGG